MCARVRACVYVRERERECMCVCMHVFLQISTYIYVPLCVLYTDMYMYTNLVRLNNVCTWVGGFVGGCGCEKVRVSVRM